MPSRSSLVQDRALRSRSAIVEAAEELWAERPVAAVKVEEICVLAGISKGLFYFYFDGREALAAELVAIDADAVADAVAARLAAGDDVEDLIRAAVTTLGRRAQHRPRHVLDVAVPEWLRRGGATTDADGLHVPLAATFTQIARLGIDAGVWRDDVPDHEIGSLLADASALAVHEWAVATSRQPSLARRLSVRVELILWGAGR